MKTVPKFYTGNTDVVNAYQNADIDKLSVTLGEAFHLWKDEWRKQGSTDEGTCTGGKGIRVWYLAPRKRSAKPITVVDSPPCQGNLSASRSVGSALKFLKDSGVDARYYDGWID